MFRNPSHLARSRRLGIEGLEPRSMLAGNITAEVIDGVLLITGDAEANDVQIRQLTQTFEGEWPGAKLEISGKNLSNNTTTTVNGESAALVVEGVKAGTTIRLGAGDDGLRIANIPGGSSVSSAPQVAFPGRISISSDAGADDLRLYLKNGNRIFVNSGADADYVQLTASTVKHLTLNSDPIPPEGGSPVGSNDRLLITNLKSSGDVKITSGLGIDDFDIKGGCQFDGSFVVDLGGGDDQLLIVGATASSLPVFNGSTTIVGAAGNDGFNFSGSLQETFTVELGVGSDIFIAHNVTSSSVTLVVDFAGGSDNAIFMPGVDVFGVDLDGGSGFDRLNRKSGAELGIEQVSSFEEDTTD